MAAIRRAQATWSGDLMAGQGTVTAATSGIFKNQPITWAARSEEQSGGKTSPEELLAAAHAGCLAMALSNGLAKAGTPAERLDVSCAITFDKTDAGFRAVMSALEVRGTVKGIDAAGFTKAAEAAKDGCPISNALKGNVAMTVKATLT